MRSIKSGARTTLVLAGLTILSACPADTKVSVRDGSTVHDLTFEVSGGSIRGGPTELGIFLVLSCAASFSGPMDKYWEIVASTHPSAIGELAYGVAPPGYRTTVGPRPLRPSGCYAALFSGAGDLYFVTDASGQVREISRDEVEERMAG